MRALFSLRAEEFPPASARNSPPPEPKIAGDAGPRAVDQSARTDTVRQKHVGADLRRLAVQRNARFRIKPAAIAGELPANPGAHKVNLGAREEALS